MIRGNEIHEVYLALQAGSKWLKFCYYSDICVLEYLLDVLNTSHPNHFSFPCLMKSNRTHNLKPTDPHPNRVLA